MVGRRKFSMYVSIMYSPETYVVPLFNEPHYAVLIDDTLTPVWTPEAGKRIHAMTAVVSVEGEGVVDIYKNGTLFMTLQFKDKDTVPISIAEDVVFDDDEVIKALYTPKINGNDAFITIFGHEH